MCRKARVRGRKRSRWIFGSRGLWEWCYYICSDVMHGTLRFYRVVPGGSQSIERAQQRMEEMAKRPNVDDVLKAGGGLGPAYGDAGKMFPHLCSWLCDTTYEDGSPKGRTRLQVERTRDRITVTLKDADSGLCVQAAHESLTDAVLTLELLLGHDDCPWTLDPFPLAAPKGKKKK